MSIYKLLNECPTEEARRALLASEYANFELVFSDLSTLGCVIPRSLQESPVGSGEHVLRIGSCGDLTLRAVIHRVACVGCTRYRFGYALTYRRVWLADGRSDEVEQQAVIGSCYVSVRSAALACSQAWLDDCLRHLN